MINSNVVLSQDDEYPKMDQRAFFVSIGENDDRPWDGNCVHHSWNLFHHDGQKTEANGDFNEENCPKLDRYIYIYVYVCVYVVHCFPMNMW